VEEVDSRQLTVDSRREEQNLSDRIGVCDSPRAAISDPDRIGSFDRTQLRPSWLGVNRMRRPMVAECARKKEVRPGSC
jgi:hypothetical protein